MVESVEHVIVGAGPAGLRAAQVLAEAGREVLVLEKNDEIGPKTCGGGLTLKAVRELEALGLPAECGLDLLSFASRRHDSPLALHPYYGRVRTVPRRALGAFQAARVRSAGADLRTGAAAAGLDPAGRTLTVDGRVLRYRHLLAADGSKSLVRRALGLAGSRAFFAGEYNIPGLAREHLWVVFDSPALGNGYFWIFPHRDYASVGAGVHKKLIAPNAVRPYLDGRMAELGIDPGDTPYEGATIEVQFVGFDFPGGVHLVGDAAGVASGLTF
ncbi:MAG: NAD(P)/FAD-dependent oxidoreductase, partial [Gemmatimonadetes bacterium]|nr:NAD(P)/FAD-dependent oxidoreductase [Gemmatimonadota bacterium]